MIRFSAALVVIAIGILGGGVATSKLSLVYVAIAVSAAALVVLAIGVVLKRKELFGEEPRRPADASAAGAGAGAMIGQPAFVGQATPGAFGQPAVGHPGNVGQGAPVTTARDWPARDADSRAPQAGARGHEGARQSARPFDPPRPDVPLAAGRGTAAADVPPAWYQEPDQGTPWHLPSRSDAPLRGRHAGPAASGPAASGPAASGPAVARGSASAAPAPPAKAPATPPDKAPASPAKASAAPPAQPPAAPPTQPVRQVQRPTPEWPPPPPPSPPSPPGRPSPPSWFDRPEPAVGTSKAGAAGTSKADAGGPAEADRATGSDTTDRATADATAKFGAFDDGADDIAKRRADAGVAREGAVDDTADDRGAAAPETAEKKTVGGKTTGAKPGNADAAREKTATAGSGDIRRADATKTAGAPAAAPRARDDNASVDTGAEAQETNVAAEASPAINATVTTGPDTTPADTAAPDTAAPDSAAPDTAKPDTARAAAADGSSGPDQADVPAPAAADATEVLATRRRPDAGQPAELQRDDAKTVTVVPGVPRYHDAHCILIRFMGEDDVRKMPLAEATAAGCTPCRACQPDNLPD